ncbi:MAG TPA: hypothetical protein VHQ90_09645 [Thermoanaerobaculia bacterium]|nr:hypothetical protein [Thermoanaerobaculia bacterium]
MRRAAIAFFTLVATSAALAAVVQDIAGWADTRWGMSFYDLRKTHPDLKLETRYSPSSYVGRLPDVTIGTKPFQIYLQFDGMERAGSSGGDWFLKRVELQSTATACYYVAETLIAKYGQPTKQESELTIWVLPTTTVRQVISLGKCIIIYYPTDKSDNL